jgi:hypothetical protein
MPARSSDFLDITPYIQIGKNVIHISGHALTVRGGVQMLSACLYLILIIFPAEQVPDRGGQRMTSSSLPLRAEKIV